MEKYIFILSCVLAIFMLAVAVIGLWKNQSVTKVVSLGASGGTFAGLAYILYTLPWK